MLAPFAKKPMRITLKGITNGPDDPSVSWCACPHWEQGSGGKGGRFFVYCRVPNEDTKFNKMWVFFVVAILLVTFLNPSGYARGIGCSHSAIISVQVIPSMIKLLNERQ